MLEMLEIDKMMKLFEQKHNIEDYLSSVIVIEELFQLNNNKKMVDFNELEKKNAPDFGILGNTMEYFYKLFFEGETTKSLKDNIFPPLINNKTKEQHIMYIRNNKLIINKCILVSLYSHKQKQYKWVGTNPFCDTMQKGTTFCNANIINNVKPVEADSISLWFRVMVYIDKHFEKNKCELKTTNLIKFTITDTKRYGDVSLYVLADYGIKDPPVKTVEKLLAEMEKKNQTKAKRITKRNQNNSHKIERKQII